jgi:hypothetical protein
MITKEPRVPKVGERVDFQQSVYVVLRVYADRKRADLQLVGSDYQDPEVPWGSFAPVSKDDSPRDIP